MPRELQTRNGDTLYIVERGELEAARGWNYIHGGSKGRGACVMHDGDNPTAMEADFRTGWITCHTRGCRGRLADHPDTLAGRNDRTPMQRRTPAPSPPPAAPPRPAPDPGRVAALQVALAAAIERLPGSAGEQYLQARGFDIEQAIAAGLGFGGDGNMAGRLVFPLAFPDGTVTSATGRDTTGRDKPKYWTLPADDYPKGWVNGGAVAIARAEGLPLYCCEGPFDALALLAGGIRTAVAVLGTSGVRADWLVGVGRLVICFDDDPAGSKGRDELGFAAGAAGAAAELMPTAILGGWNDLGEYWQAHRALPPALVEHWAEVQELASRRDAGVGEGLFADMDGDELRSRAVPDEGLADAFADVEAILTGAGLQAEGLGAVAAMVATLHGFTDIELRELRREYEAAPADDPVTADEWAALLEVEAVRWPNTDKGI